MTRPDAFRVGPAGVLRLTAVVIAALIAGGISILLLAPSSTATTCVAVSICNYDDSTGRVQLALESGASVDERGAMSAPPRGEITGQGGSSRTSTFPNPARYSTNSGRGSTRVGRWMSLGEYDTMTTSGRVVEGAGGRTFVVDPPNSRRTLQRSPARSTPSSTCLRVPEPVHGGFDRVEQGTAALLVNGDWGSMAIEADVSPSIEPVSAGGA